MKKVSEISKEFNVSIRTLHYYDNFRLLVPEKKNGVRFYSAEDENKLKIILFYRECDLSLLEIKTLIDKSDFKLLEQKRDELISKRNRINEMIMFIDEISTLKRHPSSIKEITNPFGVIIRQIVGDEQTNSVYKSLDKMDAYPKKLEVIFDRFQKIKDNPVELHQLISDYYSYFTVDLHMDIIPLKFGEIVKDGLKTSNYLNKEDSTIFTLALDEFTSNHKNSLE